ncbi:MAG TPA: hypothetical protein VFQ79_06125, partial [Bryobacteraceae bacterium]|nr:hypothetical protein [Bryobacteraceae bacterium]
CAGAGLVSDFVRSPLNSRLRSRSVRLDLDHHADGYHEGEFHSTGTPDLASAMGAASSPNTAAFGTAVVVPGWPLTLFKTISWLPPAVGDAPPAAYFCFTSPGRPPPSLL